MRYGQIFVTEEPGRSFLCIKQWARDRAEEMQQAAKCQHSNGKRKFEMGAGHRQSNELDLPTRT